MVVVSIVTASRGVGPDAQRTRNGQLTVTPFDIPNSRVVHGKKFPLGLELKSENAIVDIDTAIQKIEELVQEGVFRELLTDRKRI